MGAESGSGSTSLNAIPKSGSNTFAGGLDGYFSNGAMQGSNIRDNLNDWAQGNQALLSTAGDQLRRARCDQIYRTRRADRRPDQAGQDLVLRGDRALGFHGPAAERLLQPAAGQGEHPRQGRRRSDADVVLSRASRASPYAKSLQRLRTPAGRPRASTGIAPTPAASRRRSTPKNRINFYADLQKDCRCTTGPVHRRELDRIRARLGLVRRRASCRARGPRR